MTNDFEVPAPEAYGENQGEDESRPKTIWPVFPPWGTRGYLVEFRPPSQWNKYPIIMVQSIERNQASFKKARKKFNAKQLETGLYTPTLTISFDALPILIKAFSEAWEAHRGEAGAAQVIPQAEGALDDYRKMAQGQMEDMALATMGEFGGGKRATTPAAPIVNPWDEIKRARESENEGGDPSAPIEEGAIDEDELAGFAEFGGAPGKGKKKGVRVAPHDDGVPF